MEYDIIDQDGVIIGGGGGGTGPHYEERGG